MMSYMNRFPLHISKKITYTSTNLGIWAILEDESCRVCSFKGELVDTYAFKLQPSLSERLIVDEHGCHTALHFGVKAKENQDKVPTLYLLHKLQPYKAKFIANSSSCTTTELSKLLTLCLTAVKKHFIKYCEKVYERSGKNLFWSIKNSGEILDKLKARDFNATSLYIYL